MPNPGFSEKPQKSTASSGEDIPAALRDTPDAIGKGRFRPLFFAIAASVGFILLASISGYFFSLTSSTKTTNTDSSASKSNPPTTSAQPQSATATGSNKARSDQVLGHLAYPEAPANELVPISGTGIKMRKAAAEKFQAMVEAARANGVTLVPLSAFRSVKDQEQLFFGVGAQRNQTPAERAALSAPPGYSEHHTGYAVDIGDGTAPATDLNENFEKTKAYQWLSTNGARFGFEISFPRDNPQGVSYEPWHWRFVGDTNSLETFYRAQNLKPKQSPTTSQN